ncbi:hypothetical protein [Pseudomonas schmalbachii]|nr:hypothetical protein [Pseudomonas schmalbachii]
MKLHLETLVENDDFIAEALAVLVRYWVFTYHSTTPMTHDESG